jgi:hypothetical protein
MVKLEHDWVPLAAVDARVRLEVRDQEAGPLQGELPLRLAGLIDVPLPVGFVVRSVISGPAGPTEVVALASAASPIEISPPA